MQKIQQISSRFHFCFSCIMFILPVLAIVYWAFFPYFKSIGLQVSHIPIEYMSESIPSRMAALGVTLMPIINIMVGVYWLQRLFSNFSENIVFSMSNVRIYRNIGITLFCLSITDNLFNTLITWVMTYQLSSGPQWAFGIDTAQIIYVIMGGLIWLTSYVLKEAYQLEYEARLTI